MDDPMLTHELDKEEDHEPEPCAECDNGVVRAVAKSGGYVDGQAVVTGWEFEKCKACNGTGYKPECKCKGLGIVRREDYDWAWVPCPDCEENDE